MSKEIYLPYMTNTYNRKLDNINKFKKKKNLGLNTAYVIKGKLFQNKDNDINLKTINVTSYSNIKYVKYSTFYNKCIKIFRNKEKKHIIYPTSLSPKKKPLFFPFPYAKPNVFNSFSLLKSRKHILY